MLSRFARFLDSRHLFLPMVIETPYYDRLDKAPGTLAALIASRLGAGGPLPHESRLQRRLEAVRLPTGGLTHSEVLPPIEVLVVCAEKDFLFLAHSLQSACNSSMNPIQNLTVIVPDSSVEEAQRVLAETNFKVPVRVLPEGGFLSSKLMSKLKLIFGSRAGWILQQYLSLEYVYRSSSEGVLVLDADTFCLVPSVWLTSERDQVLHVSSEFVPEYYNFLSRYGLSETIPKYTHVTHHMMMQPEILREIIRASTLEHPVHLLEKVISESKSSGQTLFCIEFEVYAQGLARLHPEKVWYQKFANRSISFGEASTALRAIAKLKSFDKPLFLSVSFHSYVRE